MAGVSETIDIEKIVLNWAREEFDDTATKKQRQLRNKEIKKKQTYINMTIDWSDVQFSDSTYWPPLTQEVLSPKGSPQKAGTAISEGATSTGMAGEAPRPCTSSLFKTKFANNTLENQEYNMKTEKTTKSSCETSIENGYTKGFSMEVTLKSPGEIMEANAGYSREYSLSNCIAETFEEEMTWGVESQITVKAGHMAEAELVVSEKKYSGRFKIETKIRGTVYVSFTNLRDNNSFLKKTSHTIDQIFQEFLKTERRKGKSYDFITVNEETGTVTIKTEGKCNFRFGVSQEVKINQRKLTDEEKAELSSSK